MRTCGCADCKLLKFTLKGMLLSDLDLTYSWSGLTKDAVWVPMKNTVTTTVRIFIPRDLSLHFSTICVTLVGFFFVVVVFFNWKNKKYNMNANFPFAQDVPKDRFTSRELVLMLRNTFQYEKSHSFLQILNGRKVSGGIVRSTNHLCKLLGGQAYRQLWSHEKVLLKLTSAAIGKSTCALDC